MNITSVCFVIIYLFAHSTVDKVGLTKKKAFLLDYRRLLIGFIFDQNIRQTDWRERDFFFSFVLVTIVKTEDTRGPKYLYRCVGRSLLDGSSTPWENPFGQVPQHTADAGFRTGIELECNR